jgi:hypothetical protein
VLRELIACGSGAALLEGPPGIGKTVLLDAALVDSPGRVLRARGSELEGGLAFGAVRQLFGSVMMALDPAAREGLLDGPAARAAPVLGLPGPQVAAPGLVDPLYGLFWLVAGLAERSALVLAVDDLHWVDPESARFVAYMLNRLEDLPVVLLASARPAEPGIDEVTGAAQAEFALVLRPQPLSAAAVGRLVHGADPEVARRATGGNPLFALELSRALRSAPPGTAPGEMGTAAVARLVLERVAKVSPDAVALARAVALFPDGAVLEDAAAIAGLADAAAGVAADGLAKADVLRSSATLSFAHPIMRAGVYDELGPFERRRGHQLAAERLTAAGAPVESVAAHLLASPPNGEARTVALLCQAAELAVARSAPRAAARYLERAVAENASAGSELRTLLIELGRLQRQTGNAAARQTLTRAMDLSGSGPERVTAAIELATAAYDAADPATMQVAIRAVAEVESDADDRLMLDMLDAETSWMAGDMRRCTELIGRCLTALPAQTADAVECSLDLYPSY